MPKNIQEERLRWVLPIIRKEIKLCEASKMCPQSERSLKRWVKAYRDGGPSALIAKSTQPKTQPNETPIRIKVAIIALRKQTGLCTIKLHWRLEKHGVSVPVSTIGKILKSEALVRKYRTKKVKYKYIRVQRKPGELIEIDVKYVPGYITNRMYYQYTAIDTASRWRYLAIYDDQSSYHALLFLAEAMEWFPYTIQAVKTDNHSTFTNYYLGTNKRSDMTVKTLHALDRFCAQHNTVHYLIDPGKPAQNGTVERSHREEQEKFYEQKRFRSIRDLLNKIRVWNTYYNNLEHCGLSGKTPNEFLADYKLIKPPNVLA